MRGPREGTKGPVMPSLGTIMDHQQNAIEMVFGLK